MLQFQMTKLLQWLFCISLIFGIWFATITSNSTFVKQWHKTILFLPVTSLFFFGLYAVTVILYRVFTFNTCESAAIELQQVSILFVSYMYIYFCSLTYYLIIIIVTFVFSK